MQVVVVLVGSGCLLQLSRPLGISRRTGAGLNNEQMSVSLSNYFWTFWNQLLNDF